MNLPALPGDRHECLRVGSILSLVGDKWTVMIVIVLSGGPRRFSDIKRTIGGISQQMLTRTLKSLERDGMVLRTVHPTVPPQVEYELSALGHSLTGPLHMLSEWAGQNLVEIEASRAGYDERARASPA